MKLILTCLRIPSYLNIMKFLRIFRIPSYLNIMKCCAVNSKIINIMKFYYDTMVIWSRVIHVSDITTNKKQKQNYAWTFMLKAWDSNHHNWLSTFLYFFEIFLRTHSMPSLTPSPLVAEHAWICHTRSWQSLQRFSHRCCHCYSVQTGAHLDFYLIFYLTFILCKQRPSAIWAEVADPMRSCLLAYTRMGTPTSFSSHNSSCAATNSKCRGR